MHPLTELWEVMVVGGGGDCVGGCFDGDSSGGGDGDGWSEEVKVISVLS